MAREAPVIDILDLLGRRWSLRLVWELRRDAIGFAELRERTGISSSVLAQRLRELSAAGVVESGAGRRYRLSPAGRELARVLYDLNRWAEVTSRAPDEVILDSVSETELSVICKNCGSEVSPYVTECPYCGARLRKRAPKLERRGDGFEPKPARSERRRRRPRLRRRLASLDATRPYATYAIIGASVAMTLLQRALDKPLADFGAISGPVGTEMWRYLTAPFAYQDIGYLFVVGVMVAIFAPGLERRLGSFSTLLLLVACGSLGMLAADGIETALGEITLAAGGNGLALGAVAAWFAVRHSEARGAIDEDYDFVGVAVAAAVLLALPIFEDTANVFAGLAGGVVGALAGLAAATLRPGD